VLSRVWGYIATRRTLIAHLQRRGVQCIPWVLNTDHDFKRVLDTGVDGVMTDFPEKLAQYYQRYHPERAARLGKVWATIGDGDATAKRDTPTPANHSESKHQSIVASRTATKQNSD
jgi:hypothetical protein